MSRLASLSGEYNRSKRSASVLSDDGMERHVRRREESVVEERHIFPPSPASSGYNTRQDEPVARIARNLAGEVDEVDEVDNWGPRVLALHAPGQNNLAAAYYDPETRKLQVLEDTKDTWGWDLAILLVEQFQPEEVVLSYNAPDALTTLVNEYCTAHPATKSVSIPPTNFTQTMATYHLAAARLPRDAQPTQMSWSNSGRGEASLDDESATGDEDENENGAGMGRIRLSLLKMGCMVNVDAPHAVCAAGALLNHLINTQSDLGVKNSAGFSLDGIESMDLDQHMMINQDALTSIAVFDVESHANMHTQKGRPGLSLNGVINTTVTPLGRKLFHTWLLRPLINLDRINERLDAVQLLSSRDYVQPRKSIKRELKNIKNVVVFCQKIKSGRASWKDWQGLVEVMKSGLSMKDSLAVFNLRGSLYLIDKLNASLNTKVHRFLMDILQLIDWDMSRDENRVCIRAGIDDELDQWREDYARLEPLLNEMSRVMIQRIPPDLCQLLNVIYLPQLGCLVAVHDLLNPDIVPSDWEQQFNTDDVYYFKTPEMHNLDEHYGDLQNIIMDREIEWVQQLAERIYDVEEDLVAAGEAIAELDCLLAFADAVDRFDLKRPVMRQKPILKIRKGFHPLHAMCLPSGQYIENDTVLQGGEADDQSSMMVVTGANGSGKSAYGKQVALITFMAHIGCFVPAESAEIGICDKIFTRVQTRESASKNASAFMIDLSQVSQALRGATERSLLILDEFGKGTTSSDGAGLLAGVITFLLRGPKPRTVILTHYHELFAQQFLDQSLAIIFCHMKSFVAAGSNALTYLYKLTPTMSLTSNAAECALMHGIPEDVVERARAVSDCVSKFQITKLIDAQLTEDELEALRAAEDLTKRFISWNLDDEDGCILDDLWALIKREKADAEVLEPGEGSGSVSVVERKQYETSPLPEVVGVDAPEDLSN